MKSTRTALLFVRGNGKLEYTKDQTAIFWDEADLAIHVEKVYINAWGAGISLANQAEYLDPLSQHQRPKLGMA